MTDKTPDDRIIRRRQRDATLSRRYRRRQKSAGIPNARTFYAEIGQTFFEILAARYATFDDSLRAYADDVLAETKARLQRSGKGFTATGIAQRSVSMRDAALAANKLRDAIRAMNPEEAKRRGTPATWEAFEKAQRKQKKG